jgi:hypothetical protein
MPAPQTGQPGARLETALRGALELRDPGPAPARLRAVVEAATAPVAATRVGKGRTRGRVAVPQLGVAAAACAVLVALAGLAAATRPDGQAGAAPTPIEAPAAVFSGFPGVTIGGDAAPVIPLAAAGAVAVAVVLLMVGIRVRRRWLRVVALTGAALVALALAGGQAWFSSLAPLQSAGSMIPGAGTRDIDRVVGEPGTPGSVVHYSWRPGGAVAAPILLTNDGSVPISVLGLNAQRTWDYLRLTGLSFDTVIGNGPVDERVAVPPAITLAPGAVALAWVGIQFSTCGPGSSMQTGADVGGMVLDTVDIRYEMLGVERTQQVPFGYEVQIDASGLCTSTSPDPGTSPAP